jgi:hypothetical protein
MYVLTKIDAKVGMGHGLRQKNGQKKHGMFAESAADLSEAYFCQTFFCLRFGSF